MKGFTLLAAALAVTTFGASAKADYYDGNAYLRDLAYRIEYQAQRAYDSAVRYVDPRDYYEQEAIDRLRELKCEADDFQRAVDNFYYSGPSATRYAFERLDQDYRIAQPMFSRLRAYRYDYQAYSDVVNTMQLLRNVYNGSYYPPNPGHQPGRPNPPARRVGTPGCPG